MEYENFESEVRDGIAWVQILSAEAPSVGDLCDEFVDMLLRHQEDTVVRAVILTDGLRPFDLDDNLEGLAQERAEGQDFGALAPRLDSARRLVTALQELSKPVVAAAAGPVREAGFGLFLAADVRLAAATATFTPPDLVRGLLPDWGLTHSLPRLVGPGRTLELLWSGRTLDAAEAARSGLVDRVIPAEVWEEELDLLARRLASLPQPVVRLTKLAAQQSGQFDLTSMFSFEFEAQQQCWESRETAEGLAAFLDDRPPRFAPPAADTDEDDAS